MEPFAPMQVRASLAPVSPPANRMDLRMAALPRYGTAARVAMAKDAYWQRTEGVREGLFETAQRLVGVTMVSPHVTPVALEADSVLPRWWC